MALGQCVDIGIFDLNVNHSLMFFISNNISINKKTGDDFKTEVPTENRAELKKCALAKPLQVLFSISSALEIDVSWTSLGETQLQVR